MEHYFIRKILNKNQGLLFADIVRIFNRKWNCNNRHDVNLVSVGYLRKFVLDNSENK